MQTPIGKALWLIESHFARAISLEEIAALCGLSRFQMSRLFSHRMGMSLSAYIRARRLTEAARVLARGAPDILGLALDAGYGSHEAFSRAFRSQFGLTPAEVRTRGHLSGMALIDAKRDDQRVSLRLPPPRLEVHGPLTIAGMGRRFADQDFTGIPALWQELRPHLGNIPGQTGKATYGVVADVGTAASGYLYLAGVEVSGISGLGRDFTSLRLPAKRWAIFAHHGHVTTITSVIEAIVYEALPEARLVAAPEPDVLERYGRGFDPRTGNGGFEIWVPLA